MLGDCGWSPEELELLRAPLLVREARMKTVKSGDWAGEQRCNMEGPKEYRKAGELLAWLVKKIQFVVLKLVKPDAECGRDHYFRCGDVRRSDDGILGILFYGLSYFSDTSTIGRRKHDGKGDAQKTRALREEELCEHPRFPTPSWPYPESRHWTFSVSPTLAPPLKARAVLVTGVGEESKRQRNPCQRRRK